MARVTLPARRAGGLCRLTVRRNHMVLGRSWGLLECDEKGSRDVQRMWKASDCDHVLELAAYRDEYESAAAAEANTAAIVLGLLTAAVGADASKTFQRALVQHAIMTEILRAVAINHEREIVRVNAAAGLATLAAALDADTLRVYGPLSVQGNHGSADSEGEVCGSAARALYASVTRPHALHTLPR